MSRLRLALTVGPHAGTTVTVADMLTWPPSTFVATIGAVGVIAAGGAAAAVRGGRAPTAAEVGASTTAQRQLRAVSTVWAAAQPRGALDGSVLHGFAAAAPEAEGEADRVAAVRTAAEGARLTPRERRALASLQAAYAAKIAPIRAAKQAALATLAATLLPVHAAAPLARADAAAALEAADALAHALAAGADADLELQVDAAVAVAPARGSIYIGLRYPHPPSAADLVDCVAVDAGGAPLAVVLGDGAAG